MKKLGILLSAVALFMLSGCATIFNGTEEDLTIRSNPMKAKVVVVNAKNNMPFWEGKTPATVTVPKKNEYMVQVSMPGYKPAEVYVSQSLELNWTLASFFCTGLVGIVVDFVTGGMWNLSPTEINITLKTAMVDGKSQVFALFVGKDDQGQLRYMSVPMVKN